MTRVWYFSLFFLFFFLRTGLFNFPEGSAVRDAAERTSRCAGDGLRIAGLITRGRVLDWCPPAVLFSPIRGSICCITRLLSSRTSHPRRRAPARGARCTLLLLSALTTQNNPNDYKRKKERNHILFGARAPAWIQAAHLRPDLNVTAPLIASAQVFRWVARNC